MQLVLRIREGVCTVPSNQWETRSGHARVVVCISVLLSLSSHHLSPFKCMSCSQEGDPVLRHHSETTAEFVGPVKHKSPLRSARAAQRQAGSRHVPSAGEGSSERRAAKGQLSSHKDDH
ncbi:unnamed protein product [Pleuronectes platessa]|uniref:Uncharacterized protein n=1 Tax=Pleuronectes platessa TaxID=8262 RepID=A0A9N7YZA2_PLEPL|nr:unnamed protein product [Pleuronectes platessa]